jgi:hypothetical protein
MAEGHFLKFLLRLCFKVSLNIIRYEREVLQRVLPLKYFPVKIMRTFIVSPFRPILLAQLALLSLPTLLTSSVK